MSSGDFSFGSEVWPGLGKLIEECGELTQVCGKLIATAGDREHWDGKEDLRVRLEKEVADVLAAISFVVDENGLDSDRIDARVKKKYDRFNEWHDGK